MPEERRPGVQSIDRAVAILRCFDARTPELGISDIARRTGLSTSTTHRLLTSMSDNNLVRQVEGRLYRLGPLILQLSSAGVAHRTWVEIALEVARAARDETGETVGIHELLPDGHRSVVAQVESRHELRRTYTELGNPLPLPFGAPGKAILAFIPHERQEWWLGQHLEAPTPKTITDREMLRQQLDEIRERGWAYSDAERTPGIRAVAAPVFDPSGRVMGAMGLSVPTVRMPDDLVPERGQRIKEAADAVSRLLGASLA